MPDDIRLLEGPSGAGLLSSVEVGRWVAVRMQRGGGTPQRVWLKVVAIDPDRLVHAQLVNAPALLSGEAGRVWQLQPGHVHAVAPDHP